MDTRNCGTRLLAGLAALALAVTALSSAAVARAPRKSDSVVKASAAATPAAADGTQTVTITLDVEKPWHLYANPVGNKDLEDNQTEVTVTAGQKPGQVRVAYPAGTLVKDAVVGDYRVYEGHVTIKANVQRARGDSSPLQVNVRLQACSDKGCLLPATVTLTAR